MHKIGQIQNRFSSAAQNYKNVSRYRTRFAVLFCISSLSDLFYQNFFRHHVPTELYKSLLLLFLLLLQSMFHLSYLTHRRAELPVLPSQLAADGSCSSAQLLRCTGIILLWRKYHISVLLSRMFHWNQHPRLLMMSNNGRSFSTNSFPRASTHCFFSWLGYGDPSSFCMLFNTLS